MDRPLIVSYATPGFYEREAARLRSSAERLGLDCRIVTRPLAADWIRGVQQRVDVLVEARRAEPGRPLLWVDADAVIWEDPWPGFLALDADFAAHWFRDRELLGGTLYFAPTARATALLEAWADENRGHPGVRCQRNLQAAFCRLERGGLRAVRLGPEYCCIFDLSREAYPGVRPIIEHFQASRVARVKGAT